jgi:hypothetical protein
MNFASPEALGALVVMFAGWACRETLFQWWRRRFPPESASRNDSRRE